MASPALPTRVPLTPPNFSWIQPSGQPTTEFAKYMAYVDAMLQALRGLVAIFGGTVSTDTNAVGHTLPVAALLSGALFRSGPAGVFNDTTPTAAQIVAAIPGAIVGSARLFFIGNNGGGLMTILAGAGVTLSGTTTIAAGSGRWYLLTVTNATLGAEAVTIQGLNVGTI